MKARHLNLATDINELLALYSVSFPKRRFDERWIHWFASAPGGSKIYVALNNNEIVGSLALLNRTLSDSGDKLDMQTMHMICTRPDYRCQGIYRGLFEFAKGKEKKPMLLVSNQVSVPVYLQTGGKLIRNLEIWRKEQCIKSEIHYNKVPFLNDAMMSNGVKLGFDFHLLKKSEFLNWRLVIHPIYRYDVFSELNIAGFIALKLFDGDVRRAHLMELQSSNDERMLELAEDYAARRNVSLDLWVMNSKFENVLKERGFNQVGTDPLIGYGFNVTEGLSTFNPKAWFSYADSDQV